MKNIVFSLLITLLLSQISFAAQINEEYNCDITYYNNVVFEGMPVSDYDNTAHKLNLKFYLDSNNNLFYNSDNSLIENAIVTDKNISVNWDSEDVPRFCFLFDRINKTVQYKAFYSLPARPIGNTGIMTPPSTTKSNGHGICKIVKI